MTNRVRWRMGALASAIALLGSLASLDVHALALGRITVQSALGEPLRAEVDILEISAEEAGSLKAVVAGPEAFKFAGLDYNAAVVGLQISLQKRADGRSFLHVSSNRPVAEPFVDLVLDASWASGRIVRDYTMLFDPPALRQSGVAGAPAAPIAPLLPRPAPSTADAASTPYRPPVAARATPARPAQIARAPAPAPRPNPVASAPAGRPSIQVKQGDTASKIAAQNKPDSISLDQMLLALLTSNPEAFSGGNINRLKAGAVLAIPGSDEAGAVPTAEASRTIVAQARDFNEFRRKLAEGVPTTQAGNANRQASGKLEAKVEDRAPATATPDKLTLSKGAVQSNAAAEDRIAKERQATDASKRVAELSKNISDLNKLSAGPAAAPSAAASAAKGSIAIAKPGALPAGVPASAAPAVVSAAINASAPRPASTSLSTATSTAPSLTAASDARGATTAAPTAQMAPASVANGNSTPTLAALSAASAVSAPTLTASAPVLSASQAALSTAASAPVTSVAKKPVAAPAATPESGLIGQLTENPLVLPGLATLLLLLAGFGFYRYKNRNSAAQVDSSFLESRLQRDSFFGASGGQRIDTSDGGSTGSSLAYSPSQLDAAGDVDPVAEADVYLAYGRDLQAEEILKEAMRTSPTRVAIHAKLMEIYAKRRDVKAFEVVAVDAYNLTRGEGPDWAYMGEMGRELDPTNPMYQPGGQPQAMGSSEVSDPHFDASAFGASTLSQAADARYEAPAATVDFDLDLDFSMGDAPGHSTAPFPSPQQPAVATSRYEHVPTESVRAAQEPIFDGLEMDFLPATAAPKSKSDQSADTGLEFDGLEFTSAPPTVSEPTSSATPAAAAVSARDNGMLEFDLGSLSLELDSPSLENPGSAAPFSDDPLETKFALAEEFRAVGDMDGARALAEEVAALSDGSLKNKARAFLNALA